MTIECIFVTVESRWFYDVYFNCDNSVAMDEGPDMNRKKCVEDEILGEVNPAEFWLQM